MGEEHWLQKEGGLRFKCTACGNCCAKPTGIVLVNLAERERIAKRMRLSLAEFEKLCTWSYDEYVRTLKTTSQGCILFDPHKRICTVYGDHPLQCRTFPMWIGNVGTREKWDDLCTRCPGAGHGNFIPVEAIKRMVVATTRVNET